MLELLTQDRAGVRFEPFIENGAVDASEVGTMGEVLFLCDSEIGCAAENAAFDFGAHDEEWGCGAVVRAGTSVFRGAATKLGKGHRHHLIVFTMGFEVSLEGVHGLG